jgi:hypothetical protein
MVDTNLGFFIKSNTTPILINGHEVPAFYGVGCATNPEPKPTGAITRSATKLVQDKSTQTERLSAIFKVPRAPKKVTTAFTGNCARLDGRAVGATLRRKSGKRKQAKRQFTKKPKSKTRKTFQSFDGTGVPLVQVALNLSVSVVSGQGVVVQETSSRRVVKVPVKFDPSVNKEDQRVQSVSGLSLDGMYTVSVLMTEEEVTNAGGRNLLRSFHRRISRN